MSNKDIAKIGGLTGRVAATATSAGKAIGEQSNNIIITNNGPSAVFVQSGGVGLTIVFPTTSTSQNGSVILAGQTQNFKKNNPTDSTLYTICDTSGTADVYFSSVDGE